MANTITSSTPATGKVVGTSTAAKRAHAKSVNSEKLAALPVSHQQTVKALRRSKSLIDAAIDGILNGGKVDANLVKACLQLQLQTADAMFTG